MKSKTWKEKTWKEKKDTIKIFSFIFLFLTIFTFFSIQHPNEKDLKTIQIKLEGKPIFKKSTGKNNSYWVELKTTEKKYKITGIDYMYINKERFIKDIAENEIITISFIEDNIYKLRKNNIEYLKFESAKFHKCKNNNFSRTIFGSGFLLSLIPLFFKNPVFVKDIYYNKKSELNFPLLLFFFWIISIIVAIYFLDDFKYISGSEFIK